MSTIKKFLEMLNKRLSRNYAAKQCNSNEWSQMIAETFNHSSPHIMETYLGMKGDRYAEH